MLFPAIFLKQLPRVLVMSSLALAMVSMNACNLTPDSSKPSAPSTSPSPSSSSAPAPTSRPTTGPSSQPSSRPSATVSARPSTSPSPAAPPAPAPSGISTRQVPAPIYGVTIDNIDNLSAIVESLRRLSRKPTTRIVFDAMPASYYVNAARQIYGVSYVMGELVDSASMKDYTTDQYLKRTTEYLNALGPNVDIWEIGNEINGEWLGNNSAVVAKMSGAYDLVKARGAKTALTLYYNQDCWSNASNEMFKWATANIPDRMKSGLDYLLVSYYEDDCNGLQPDWAPVFQKLHQMFPNSKIGFGEVGTEYANRKQPYINRYYNLTVNVPNYIGGYFWWYYYQDMVPHTNTLWNTINTAIASDPGEAAPGVPGRSGKSRKHKGKHAAHPAKHGVKKAHPAGKAGEQ